MERKMLGLKLQDKKKKKMPRDQEKNKNKKNNIIEYTLKQKQKWDEGQ